MASHASTSSSSNPHCPPLPQETLCELHAHTLSTFESPLDAQRARFTFGRVSRSWYNASCSTKEFAVDGPARAEKLRRRFAREKMEHEQQGKPYEVQVKKLYLKTGESQKGKDKGKKFAGLLDLCIDGLQVLEWAMDSNLGNNCGSHGIFSLALDNLWNRLVQLRVLFLTASGFSYFCELQDLLRHLPNLTHLRFKSTYMFLINSPMTVQLPLLTHLEILDTAQHGWIEPRVVSTLISCSLTSLRLAIVVDSPTSLAKTVQVLLTVAPRLVHFDGDFQLCTAYQTMRECFSSLFDKMTVLQELSLVLSAPGGFRTDDPTDVLLALDFNTLAKLPSLRSATFDLTLLPFEKRNSISDFITIAPSLHQLSLTLPKNWTATMVEDLKKFAMDREVRLILRDDVGSVENL